ncbi:hypothetical protein ON010_g12005 [Phytophthora cinnamomi]|nr:hypothetical protein ON010_g12005 [Phytophthora cinnamomi]
MPDHDEPWRYSVRIVPKFVSLGVLEKISSADFEQRDSTLTFLRGIPEAAEFRGHLFEMKTHELLVRGGLLETQSLPGGRKAGPRRFRPSKVTGIASLTRSN